MAGHDISLGTEDCFRDGLVQRPSLRHLLTLKGYETDADLRAFFNGEATLFDEVRRWLADEVQDGVLARQDDMRAVLWLALESNRDVVAFQLRWSEHLVSQTA